MLFIVGHVGHIWRSWETKLFETITKSKVFETNSTTFPRTIFFRSLLRLFLRQKFSRPIPRLFLRPKFSRRILRLFFETKFFETYTETFFRDRVRHSQKSEKSLDTEKSRDEMSHSDPLCLKILFWSFLTKTKQDQALLYHINGKIWPHTTQFSKFLDTLVPIVQHATFSSLRCNCCKL